MNNKLDKLNIEEKEKQLKYYNECIANTKTLVELAKDRKQQHEQRKVELEEEIKAQGVNPDNIDEEINNISEELERLIEEVDSLIPYDLLKQMNKLPERD
ncbi:hypothetical protein [Senegalia massiliensis]|uniref:Uncharacterized protein n=1 Tax=Senegalia massiliensis TaxID=1720316 RepID=A0A845R1L6_9CLOT|nr:hypothetical protein [Senegalia massiliensis]NBI07616.1 hypothetical protein [Senegalia massiliensis]